VGYERRDKMKLYGAPYRWTLGTIIPNLKSFYHQTIYGIENIIRWFPLIWRDRWWDWSYLADMMEYKLRHDAEQFEKRGMSISSKRDARRMRICAELLRRLSNETASEQRLTREVVFDDSEAGIKKRRRLYKEIEELEAYYADYLFTTMRKHMRGWWD